MAATKRLKVLSGRPGSFVLHERRVEKDKARESIQSHIILERYPAYAIAREKLAQGYALVYDDDLLKVVLNGTITQEDHRRMVVEAKLAVGDAKGAELARVEERAPFSHQKLNIVSETTKMGTYSFNLPAGPPSLGGTCPGAGPGFMFLTDAERAQQQRAMVAPIRIKERDYICDACYALKNSYGNPSQIMFQAFRYMLVLEWLQQGTFVEHVTNAIQAARIKSAARLQRLSPSLRWTVPHPDFFRIHDSGDFFSPEYTRAWFEVCRRLPDVMFWAPTRMWVIKKSASTVFVQGVPPNLTLRPSALHLGEDAPRVDEPGTARASVGSHMRLSVVMPGLSSGSGSGKQVPSGAWKCPAYAHVREGGGLGPKIVRHGARKGQKKLTKTGQVSEAEGTCSRAHGPNSPRRGGTDVLDTPTQGYGCRACWRNRDLPIFYQEH